MAKTARVDAQNEPAVRELKGRRRTPGRPVTYGTTDAFLEQFSLPSLSDLPGVAEMRAAGLLDINVPADFMAPDPSQGQGGEGEQLSLDDLEDVEFAKDYLEDEPER